MLLQTIFMSQEKDESTGILDLTCTQTLFELAIEDFELRGAMGARLIADLKMRAAEADYQHLYYRDPIRPGIIWHVGLGAHEIVSAEELNAGDAERGHLDFCRNVAESVFPGFLQTVEDRISESDEEAEAVVMQQIPPLVMNVSGMDLATALEFTVFLYPNMIRAWAALLFVYQEILHLTEAAERAREECVAMCKHPEVVFHLLGYTPDEEAAEPHVAEKS